jgi:hypothetical protein
MIDKLGGYETVYRKTLPMNCVGCGQFVGASDEDARCEYEPLSEYGPEKIEWLCGGCVQKEQAA